MYDSCRKDFRLRARSSKRKGRRHFFERAPGRMGQSSSKPRPRPAAPAPPREPEKKPPTQKEWGQIEYEFKYARDKMATTVQRYTKHLEVRARVLLRFGLNSPRLY